MTTSALGKLQKMLLLEQKVYIIFNVHYTDVNCFPEKFLCLL